MTQILRVSAKGERFDHLREVCQKYDLSICIEVNRQD